MKAGSRHSTKASRRRKRNVNVGICRSRLSIRRFRVLSLLLDDEEDEEDVAEDDSTVIPIAFRGCIILLASFRT